MAEIDAIKSNKNVLNTEKDVLDSEINTLKTQKDALRNEISVHKNNTLIIENDKLKQSVEAKKTSMTFKTCMKNYANVE